MKPVFMSVQVDINPEVFSDQNSWEQGVAFLRLYKEYFPSLDLALQSALHYCLLCSNNITCSVVSSLVVEILFVL
jgi:hypothetical protein